MADETSKILNDIRERVVRVETKLDTMNDVKETALEALQQGKSAHHRINDTNASVKELKDNQTWLWRTVLGAVIAGAIAFLWKGVGG